MMSRKGFRVFRNTLYLFLLLQSFYQSSFCKDVGLGCREQDLRKSFHVVSGRNVSLKLPPFESPLLSTQSLVWTKGESTWEKRHNDTLELTGGNVSFDVTRYELIEDTNGTLTLIISFVESDDMGKHVISVYNGEQTCTVLILNLTVESNIEHNCLTIFDKKRNKLQMTCQWVQVIEGDQAHLENAGDNVLYSHETININTNGRFNLTNTFSVYVDPRDIFDGRTLPDRCFISNHKQSEDKVCKFPPVKRYTIQNVKTENLTFQCCTSNKWYTLIDEDFKHIKFTEEIFTGSDRIVFFCGEEKHDSNATLLYSIRSLDVAKWSFNTTSVSDINSSSNSTDDSSCQTIHVSVIRNTSESKNSEETNLTNLMLAVIVSSTVLSTIAFLLTSFMCFIIIRGFYRRCVKPITRNVRMISSTVASDDAAKSIELTNISSARPRPRNDVSTDTLGRKQLGMGTMRSCQEIQSELPIISLRGNSEAVDNRSVDHTTNINEGKDLSLEQHLRETGCISTSAADCIPVGGAPTVVVPSAPFQDSTYCSVDDIEDISPNTCVAAASPMTFQPPPSPSDGQTNPPDPDNVIRNKSPCAVSVERKDAGRHDSTANRSGPTRNVNELYAEPDMSRKTKRIASLESDYDDPSVSGDDFHLNASHPVMNNSQIYINSVANPTDELYMNASGLDLIIHS